ncbi:hypothetical protein DBR47_15380 [Paucibacter sp. KBW04]|uniref:hypothetical protein n=1 Tax=Paucibacter sp. KBW04 TaxID=2153361 RepID=UPI000F588D26|nr:hypothetical protein [Paucibacter sp. KBW04]RQO57214.1 hypothetical protein DBR47_15380 [Paucibacter sp. KBW04]
MRTRLILLCLSFTMLAGCATPYNPIPKDYAGPVAQIADSVQARTASLANVFAVVEIDGKPVHNTFTASTQASQGQGFKLTQSTVTREVPAVPMRLKLSAHPLTGAPIQAMAMQIAGTFFSVEGVVDFKPEGSGRYVVRGELKKQGSSVWIEDAVTGNVLTTKVTQTP